MTAFSISKLHENQMPFCYILSTYNDLVNRLSTMAYPVAVTRLCSNGDTHTCQQRPTSTVDRHAAAATQLTSNVQDTRQVIKKRSMEITDTSSVHSYWLLRTGTQTTRSEWSRITSVTLA